MLVSDLKKFGVAAGDTIMLHASVKAIGWMVGGPDIVIQALLDVIGHEGTLMRARKVGQAQSYLFDAADFVKFAIRWIVREYKEQQ
jgi:aminoglycoside N3'-acetyltransferase